MRSTALQRLDTVAKSLSPFTITLLLILFSLVLVRAPSIAPVVPAMAMAAVFYWTIFRPDLLPLWTIFLLGLLQDLLTGAPLGISVATFFVIVALVNAQRKLFAAASFVLLWISFAFTAALAMTAQWLLGSLLLDHLIDPAVMLLHYLTTVALYPCLAWLFSQAQQTFLKVE